MGASICSPLLPGLTEHSPAQLRLRSISTVLMHGKKHLWKGHRLAKQVGVRIQVVAQKVLKGDLASICSCCILLEKVLPTYN